MKTIIKIAIILIILWFFLFARNTIHLFDIKQNQEEKTQ